MPADECLVAAEHLHADDVRRVELEAGQQRGQPLDDRCGVHVLEGASLGLATLFVEALAGFLKDQLGRDLSERTCGVSDFFQSGSLLGTTMRLTWSSPLPSPPL